MRLLRVRPKHRRGAALLIVVACLVIAGLAMVAVTRQSLRLATDSLRAETELQQRWGTISLQRTLLHSAPKVFADLDKQSLAAGEKGPFPSTVQSEIMLGGIKFNTLLADEQAKLNLNAVFHRRGNGAAELAAQKMKGLAGLSLRMLPEVRSEARRARPNTRFRSDVGGERADELVPSPPPPAFRHWGQVFDLSKSTHGNDASQMLVGGTVRLTCWGRGEVNIARAPNDVVEEACRTVLGPGVARKLVRQYRQTPNVNLNQIAMQLEVKEQDIIELRRLVTTQSSTYSLWLSSSSTNGPQRWFAVAEPVDEIGIRTERFRF